MSHLTVINQKLSFLPHKSFIHFSSSTLHTSINIWGISSALETLTVTSLTKVSYKLKFDLIRNLITLAVDLPQVLWKISSLPRFPRPKKCLAKDKKNLCIPNLLYCEIFKPGNWRKTEDVIGISPLSNTKHTRRGTAVSVSWNVDNPLHQ